MAKRALPTLDLSGSSSQLANMSTGRNGNEHSSITLKERA